MKDYFRQLREEDEKEYRRIIRAIWLGAKIGITTTIWLLSSIVVAPAYLIIISAFVKVPTNGSSGYDLVMIGGAILWYAVLYLVISLLFRWTRRKFYPALED